MGDEAEAASRDYYEHLGMRHEGLMNSETRPELFDELQGRAFAVPAGCAIAGPQRAAR